ncbi:MAG: HAD-IB family hydrolase [Acidimicrobiales bacterium]
MTSAAAELESMLQPFAKVVFEQHRAKGDLLVLATTSPAPFVRPFAERLGFDHVIATEWVDDGTHFTGEHNGTFVWGKAKATAVADWAAANGVDLDRSTAYSDSYFDAPLLDAVGTGVAVNPDLRLSSLALLKGGRSATSTRTRACSRSPAGSSRTGPAPSCVPSSPRWPTFASPASSTSPPRARPSWSSTTGRTSIPR